MVVDISFVPIAVLITLIFGATAVWVPYRVLINEFRSNTIKHADSQLTYYSLKATQYLIVGGFLSFYFGLAIILVAVLL